MKRSVLLLAIMMVSTVGFSQSSLKGPKAKNATAVELSANASPLKFKVEPSERKGASAKNEKVWNEEYAQIKIVFARREQLLKGPKAKNKKVWEN